ncbi:sigma-54-dependent Fis family transcriptional regulator [Amphritea pacifica]|uniref:sigma-54-dependent Fis family transcriptional regulator n=1 Tax=Amphritea pacifica TaxID=2811233 RepID=UPI0019668C16|nr:sigma-54-dependent Fis family transcriptional regulator [Amphritea pacifica]MBN1005560.1 sigma-54-dependent Fis family transcriptional regulator [Amphritea pacifica]
MSSNTGYSDKNAKSVKIRPSGEKDTDKYIQSSWQRCRDQYKMSPDSNVELVSLSESEVRQRREPMEKLLSDSEEVFDKIRTVSKQSGYAVLITNTEGVVVKSYADSNISHDLEQKGLRQGTLWSEKIVGTNGLGTCLTECRPVTVFAEEHYGFNLHNFSCSAAPLISPDGTPFGALDISTYASGNRLYQALALNLVCETADEIEAIVFKNAYANQRVISLSFSPHRPETNALIAVNDSDTIIAATTPLLLALGCRDRYELVGRKFQEAFSDNPGQLESSVVLEMLIQLKGKPHKLYATLLHNSAVERRMKAADSAASKPSASGLQTHSAEAQASDTPLFSAAGKEPLLLKQASRCQRIVNKGISILLQGETGTGKEVWARALHESSDRADKPFITLNCAAIPESLIESELFGYGAGTFTGGLKSGKVGKIQASHGGTLFLDEIGDMPIELQASLLRVLAENEIIPLGEVNPVKVSLNVICATHRDLKELVSRGDFREDLFYRISGFQVALPSLRERQDKPVIIENVLRALCRDEENAENVQVAPEALNVLCQYQWPGNIRQLKNVLQYAMCMREGDLIQSDDLPDEVFAEPAAMSSEAGARSYAPPSRMVSMAGLTEAGVEQPPLSEKEELEQVLEQNRWVVTRAARALGISRSTLHRKIKKYNLFIDEAAGESDSPA